MNNIVKGLNMKRSTLKQIEAFMYVVPALSILGIFVIFPILKLFQLSFTDYQLLDLNPNFIGLENFRRALNDPMFFKTLWNVTYFCIIVVPTQAALALITAIIVNHKLKGSRIFRTVYFFPVVTSFVTVCVIWRLMYDGSYGFITSLFNDVLGIKTNGFLTSADTAMHAIMVTSIWKSFGWFMMIFLAALQQIPDELYESAYLDGVSFWKKLYHITIPMLRRTILFVLVIEIIDGMKIYIPSFVMTSGGPIDSTNVLVYNIWITAFKIMDVGYASAMAVLLFIIVMIVTFIQFRVMRERD